MATRLGDPTHTMTPTERSNQRNALLAGFLGRTLDAFDFFILTLVIDGLAELARAAVGPAAGRLRARQPARRAGVPAAVSHVQRPLSGQRLAADVLPRRPAGTAVALHPGAREGVRRLARAQDRLGELPP